MLLKGSIPRTSFAYKAAVLAALTAVALGGAGCASKSRSESVANEGWRLLAGHDVPGAAECFRRAVEIMPRNAGAHYGAACAALTVGNSRAAAEALQRVLEIDPENAAAQRWLAELLATSHDPAVLAEARKRLSALAARFPRDAATAEALGAVDWKLGEPRQGVRRLEQAFAGTQPAAGESATMAKLRLATGDAAGAEKLLASAGGEAGSVALAGFYIARDRPADAERVLEALLARNQDNPAALLRLAALQAARGRNAEAAGTLRRLAASPEPSYRTLYGRFLLESGDAAGAAAEFARLGAADSSDGGLRTAFAAALAATGRESDAERLLEAAVRAPNAGFDALYQKAAFDLARGRAAAAQSGVLAALRIRPDAAEAHFLLAAVSLRRANVMSSVEELGSALERNPRFLPARIELARYRVAAGTPEVALELLSGGLEPKGKAAAAASTRAWALLAMGDRGRFQSALESARRAGQEAALAPQAALFQLGAREAAAAARRAAALLRANPVDARALSIAARASAASGPVAAIEAVRAHAAAHPTEPEPRHFLGELLLAANRPAEAVRELQRAVSLGERSAALEIAVARAAIRAGDPDRAQVRLERLAAADPDDYTARFLTGVAREVAGDSAGAAAWYRKALDVNPSHVPSMANLAWVLAEHLHGAEEALHVAEKARELAPESAAVDDIFGWVLYRRGLDEVAAVHLEAAARAGSAPALFHLAVMRHAHGDEAGARQAYAAGVRRAAAAPEIETARRALAEPPAAAATIAMANEPAHGWSSLGASGNNLARLEVYQRARGCEPDPGVLDAILAERNPARFTAVALVPMMLCDAPLAWRSSPPLLERVLAEARAEWIDPDSVLRALFRAAGIDPNLSDWDETFIDGALRNGLPLPKRRQGPYNVPTNLVDGSFRPPPGPSHEAGWNVYDSLWPTTFR